MLKKSLAENQSLLYDLETHKDVECYCPQKSDMSAFPPFVLLNDASGGFRQRRTENLYPYVTYYLVEPLVTAVEPSDLLGLCNFTRNFRKTKPH